MIQAVPEPDFDDGNESSQPPLPRFEGRPVHQAKIRVSGTVKVPLDDIVISVDDRVRLVGEYRVTGIRHYVDDATGDLVREQIIRPLDETIMLSPWGSDDDGVIRARP